MTAGGFHHLLFLNQFVFFGSPYDAQIAAICLRSLAKKRKIADLNVRKFKCEVLVWRGPLEQIPFTTPARPRVISAEAYARAQVLGVFIDAPLHGAGA